MKEHALAALVFLSSFALATEQPVDRQQLDRIEQSLRDDIPRILCLDKNFATAGQPSETAFGKLAGNGFRSVLNLRTAAEGVDIERERELVEKARLRYVHIPVISAAPKPEQVTEFLQAVKDKANYPMLIHCGSANRVGAFWAIYRVVGQGWSEEKAFEEAARIGLTSPVLKKFAQDYIATSKQRNR